MKQSLKKVFVVFKTHFDIGFTHLAEEVVSWYGKGMIEDVLEVCRATKDEPEGHKYVWTVPSWPMRKTLETIEKSEVLKETEEYLYNGQLVWHGLPFTTHTEVSGIEDFVRGMQISMKLGEKYGRRVRDAKMTDVPGHPWILPTLLHKAGIRFLHLGSNFCATPPDVPRLFWWEGPDGSRVLTYYSKGGYGSDLVPPEDWDYPYWLAMLQTLDNLGAQDTDYLKEMFERAQREMPGVEISIGTLEDFGEAMIESGVEIPVIRGDLSDTWIRGVGSAPQGVAQMRDLRYLAQSLQAAYTMSVGQGEDEAAELFRDAYEKLLLFSEHTWSMDTKVTILPERYYGAPWIGFKFWETGTFDKTLFDSLRKTEPGYLKLQESWKEQLRYLEDAKQDLEEVRNLLIKKENQYITVYGTLGFAVSHMLDVSQYVLKDIEERGISGENASYVLMDDTCSEIPVYPDINGAYKAEITLPAFGKKQYKLLLKEERTFTKEEGCLIATEEDGKVILENHALKVIIDQLRGTVDSMIYKPANREWVDKTKECKFGQYRYDIFSSDELDTYLRNYQYVLRDWGINDTGKAGYPKEQRHETFIPERFRCEVKNGHNWGGVTMIADISGRSIERYGNAKKLKVEIVLKEDKEYLDFTYTLLDKQPTPFIETGHFYFPMKTEQPEYIVNKLGCTIDPQKDVVKDCNTDLYCLEGWTAVEDTGCGLAIAVKEAPLMSYEKPGVLRFERDASIKESTLLMQGFNNAWGTNFPQWSEGEIQVSYRLIAYTGTWKENRIWQQAEKFRYVPVVVDGEVVQHRELVSACSEGLLVQTLKPSENRKGYVLRLNNISGEEGEKTVFFGAPVMHVSLCSLMEEEEQKLELAEDNSISFISKPYEILTIYFEIG